MSEILVARDIHRIYQDGKRKLHVLKGVDLFLHTKEIMMILGQSGSGKSTLLHILGLLDKPTKGEVLLEDVSVYKTDDATASRIRNERIGFVFQFYHLLSDFTALENVMMPALIGRQTMIGGKQIKKRAEELLAMVGLQERSGHRPSELSGGESQRVAIARALMNEPDIVLCDEPTGNLDHENAINIFELIKKLNSEHGQSFIIVTHEKEYTKYATSTRHLTDGVLK